MEKIENSRILVENENIVEIINLLTIKKAELENYLKNGESVQDAVHDYWNKLENGRELIELQEGRFLNKRVIFTAITGLALSFAGILLPAGVQLPYIWGTIFMTVLAQVGNYVYKYMRVENRNNEIDEANNIRTDFENDRLTALDYINTIDYLIKLYEDLLPRKKDVEDYYKFASRIYNDMLNVEVEESEKIEYSRIQGVLKVVGAKKLGKNNKVLSMPTVTLPPVSNK